MRITRFYCPSAAQAQAGDCATLTPRESRHLAVVLRLKPGDPVRLIPGNGKEWLGRVVKSNPAESSVRLESLIPITSGSGNSMDFSDSTSDSGSPKDSGPTDNNPDLPSIVPVQLPPIRTGIALAVSRGGTFELALEHLCELGTDEVIPILCRRGVVRLPGPEEAAHKLERWQRVAVSACKQSGRTTLLQVHPPQTWEDWITDPDVAVNSETIAISHSSMGLWIATPEGADQSLFDAAREYIAARFAEYSHGAKQSSSVTPIRLLAAIGPEGGFTPEEVVQALEHGFSPVWLAGHVLRVATAAAAAMTAIHLAVEIEQ